MFLEEILLDSIIYVLVLLPALQMLFAMVLSVAVWQKGNLGYLVWIVRPCFAPTYSLRPKYTQKRHWEDTTAALLEMLL